MASSSSLLSEEQFLCPICLDVFTRPVSTPCGHNFCMSCITSYWDNATFSQCPVCKEQFQRRPDLKVNTFISELALQLVSLQVTDARVWSADPQQVNSGSVVLCDICTDAQKEAVKSCLECQTSYCDVHLEPHHRAAGLKRHTLLEPSPSLDDRICKEHNRVLVLFCRDDNALLCDVCSSSRHRRHNVVPVQRAYERMKDEVENTEAKVQQMIQERLHKVQSMTESVKQSKTESEKVIANGMQDFTVLVFEIQKSQAELIRVVEEKQKTAEQQADGFISEMQREVKELQRTTVKLRELKQTRDQLRFLQSCSNTSLLPHTMDLSTVSSNKHLEMQQFGKSLRKAVSQLRVSLDKMNTEISRFSSSADASDAATLRYMQQYEVNIVLDPDSAHPMLCLSDDGKQVRYNMGSEVWAGQFLNLNMFTSHLAVLGRRGFSSGRFYFEVCTSQKTEWCLGVATASIQRRGALVRSSCCGLWAIWFLIDKFETFTCPDVPVHVGKVGRVGVFVDYNKGEISFYDVKTETLIYSFTECSFTEELYPYFNPCDNEFGSNLEPLTIVPVCHIE
ncbi:E3 ubiquitin-protein ligase TRIM21-like [Amphiprion ocellaris]|uniref:E3 ubiquitin-protein ligase TRIM39-like n=1 Tax=Amphiprion ocellaris TaxID=80972 RepID=A0AAQ5ZNZ0_AMPOC|nr:E3 ubiquitin-protein ligase TRIM21-like [Amphiprion ocellaris]XP_023143697.1 E3 ubiquitin-protein ligase TRIM21-like [Amphiprion ocellaris]